MASYRIIAWKDIPASVEARDGTDHVTLQLSERFQALIDSLAMQVGADAEDAYLEHWGSTDGERAGSAGEVGAAVAAELEERFSEFIALAFRQP
ncbi:MAG TPA: virulence factor [Methylomirabilota bacterium]|nr:virulence factor [Methylomirabilota bacterium]